MGFLGNLAKSIVLGFIAGALIGWGLKVALKVVIGLVVVAAIIGYVGVLKGWIDPKWFSGISPTDLSVPESTVLAPLWNLLLQNIPLTIAAIVGFFVGLRKG